MPPVDDERAGTRVRCAATFVERRGEVTCLCPSCDSEHIVLD